MDSQLENIYNSAKQAMADDLSQNLYNATQNRRNAFRQLNNRANYYHSMFSGMPAAQQMQYDQNTYFPGVNTLATRALAQQKENQAAWDKQIEYINNLKSQASYYNNLSNQLSGYSKGN